MAKDTSTEGAAAARPVVTLEEITGDNLRAVMRLTVKPSQEEFVAPNSVSIAEKCFDNESWMQAIYANGAPVGFVLLSERRDPPRYYLWRYMIDGAEQGKGYGKDAMDLVIEYVRSLPNSTEMFLTYVPHPEGPRDFYAKCGFVDTGREHGGELEMRLDLS